MANKIILKKSSVASKVPLASDLEIGEIAVNLADQKLYSKNASGTIVLIGTGVSGGTVTSVSGTGTVNGLTLTGTVTTSGNLTLGGTLDLSSPPPIGGSTPNLITCTTITATKYVGVSGGSF